MRKFDIKIQLCDVNCREILTICQKTWGKPAIWQGLINIVACKPALVPARILPDSKKPRHKGRGFS